MLDLDGLLRCGLVFFLKHRDERRLQHVFVHYRAALPVVGERRLQLFLDLRLRTLPRLIDRAAGADGLQKPVDQLRIVQRVIRQYLDDRVGGVPCQQNRCVNGDDHVLLRLFRQRQLLRDGKQVRRRDGVRHNAARRLGAA